MDIKALIRSNHSLHSLAKWTNARLKGTWNLMPSYWIATIVTEPDAQIVQIGSNDGRTNDPVYNLMRRRKGWRGLFVEPIPYLFERLKANYGNQARFKFENAVINNGDQVTFYWVDPAARKSLPHLPPWYDQLGSFNRDHITNHLPELEPFIRESRLNGLSLGSLFAKHQINKVHVLHIDTEGYDYKILSQLDLQSVRPKVILYEHKHLNPDEVVAAIRMLRPCYTLYELGGDTMAVPESANARMQATGLRPVPEP